MLCEIAEGKALDLTTGKLVESRFRGLKLMFNSMQKKRLRKIPSRNPKRRGAGSKDRRAKKGRTPQRRAKKRRATAGTIRTRLIH